ncbi:MAG: metallophosphoesterase [Caulobacteraceae bacterium]|nr:metallophosphoesterase [Caulobacteraceae bacterium]
MVRFAHLSDIHFGMENAPAVEATASWIAAERPDLTVVTGDLTAFGEPAEFASAAAWIGALHGERLVVPGNHDTPYLGVWERATRPFDRFEGSFGPADGLCWSNGAVCVAGVNTARGIQLRLNWSKGAIDVGQAGRALQALKGRRDGSLGVVACHHPLAEMVGGPMTARVRGGERAARRFCEGRVDLILTGHIHAPFAMALPHADGLTYAVGAGTLSVRERGAPAGFNVIESAEETIKVTALAWTGSGLDVWREWTLPRRR